MAEATASSKDPSRPSLVEIVGDGAMAGLYGAATIAVFFLIVDFALREPLYTPSLVGTEVLRLLGFDVESKGSLFSVALYTAVHCVAFVVFGTIYAWVLARLEHTPDFPLIAISVFVPLELGFVGSARLWVPDVAAEIGHGYIVAANVLASIAIATYLRYGQPHRDDAPPAEGA